jgi:hypothetical protein
MRDNEPKIASIQNLCIRVPKPKTVRKLTHESRSTIHENVASRRNTRGRARFIEGHGTNLNEFQR